MWCRTAGWGDCSVGIFCNLACKPHKPGQFMKSGRGQGCEHASATKRFRARTSLTTCTCSMICYHSLYVVLTSFAVVYRLVACITARFTCFFLRIIILWHLQPDQVRFFSNFNLIV